MTLDPDEFSSWGGAAALATHRHKACTRKEAYPSAKRARVAKRTKERVYGKFLRVYRCSFGQHWHLCSEYSGDSTGY